MAELSHPPAGAMCHWLASAAVLGSCSIMWPKTSPRSPLPRLRRLRLAGGHLVGDSWLQEQAGRARARPWHPARNRPPVVLKGTRPLLSLFPLPSSSPGHRGARLIHFSRHRAKSGLAVTIGSPLFPHRRESRQRDQSHARCPTWQRRGPVRSLASPSTNR